VLELCEQKRDVEDSQEALVGGVGVTGRGGAGGLVLDRPDHAERRNSADLERAHAVPGGELLDRPVGLMALEAGLRPGVEPLNRSPRRRTRESIRPSLLKTLRRTLGERSPMVRAAASRPSRSLLSMAVWRAP